MCIKTSFVGSMSWPSCLCHIPPRGGTANSATPLARSSPGTASLPATPGRHPGRHPRGREDGPKWWMAHMAHMAYVSFLQFGYVCRSKHSFFGGESTLNFLRGKCKKYIHIYIYIHVYIHIYSIHGAIGMEKHRRSSSHFARTKRPPNLEPFTIHFRIYSVFQPNVQ